MTAYALLPTLRPSRSAETLVIPEVSSTPPESSMVTSLFTAPCSILFTLPLSTFRALIFMTAPLCLMEYNADFRPPQTWHRHLLRQEFDERPGGRRSVAQ